VIVPFPAWLSEPVILPGLLVAVYDVMVAPPLLAGAVYETVAVVVPVAVAVPIVGGFGTLIVGGGGAAATTALVALELADALPAALVAVTTQRIALPMSAVTNVYELLVAPILTPARCH
jgi:hypothetical protein